MTREQMHAEILAAINRAPHIGVGCISVNGFKSLSTVETLHVLQGYARDLQNELISVQRAIDKFRFMEIDRDPT